VAGCQGQNWNPGVGLDGRLRREDQDPMPGRELMEPGPGELRTGECIGLRGRYVPGIPCINAMKMLRIGSGAADEADA
jgi:hypothetical protein